MPNNIFTLIDSRQASNDGRLKLSADETATTILRGMVAHRVYTADSEGNNPRITVAESVETPVGLINDYLDHIYPHKLTPADGRNIAVHLKNDYVNYVYGRFRAMVGDGLFDGAVAIGETIYGDDATGKLTTGTDVGVNTIVVGKVVDVHTMTEVDGNVYECEFDFPL